MSVVIRRLWLGILAVAFVTVCTIAGAAVRSAATTPAPSRLQVSMPGDHGRFRDQPSGPLLDFHRLAPGTAIAGVMGIRNRSAGLADVSIRMIDVREVDRCADASSCPTGGLTKQLHFSLSVANTRSGSYRRVWSGGASALRRAVRVAGSVPNRAARWVRLSARLAPDAGDDVERAALQFGLRMQLDAGLLGTTTTTLAAGHRIQGIRIAGLAATGVQVAMITALALGLLGVGGCLSLLGRRRRDAQASSQ